MTTRSATAVAAPHQRPRANPSLRVVAKGENRRRNHVRKVRIRIALSATAVVVCLFGVVVSHVLITQSQFQLTQLREKAAAEEARYNELRRTVAELESPDRVVGVAEARLGMETPDTVQYLTPVSLGKGRALAGSGDHQAAGNDSSWSTVKRQLARP